MRGTTQGLPAAFAVIVPTFRGESHVPALLDSLDVQSVRPAAEMFVDSSPGGATAAALARRSRSAIPVASASFDHGGTRQWAVEAARDLGCELAVFLSQDVILEGHQSLEALLTPFMDPEVGAVFGRQLPRRVAGRLETIGRLVRYPDYSYTANEQDAGRRYFFSNAFAAYRISYLLDAGGFPSPVLFGEDAIASCRIQSRGYRVAYVSAATARHSHPLSIRTELGRYFDIGVGMRLQEFPQGWASVSSGSSITTAEFRLAYQTGGILLAVASIAVSLLRAVGYMLGKQSWIPKSLGERVSAAPSAYRKLVGMQRRS